MLGVDQEKVNGRFDPAILSVYNRASGIGPGLSSGKPHMKRRHPMQMIDAAELVAGDVYAFVICYEDGADDLSLYEQHCLAVVADTEQLLKKRGYRRGPAGWDDEAYRLGGLLDAKSAFDATRAIQPAMKRTSNPEGITVFTAHLDGWAPDRPNGSGPSIVEWNDRYDGECVYQFDDFSADTTVSHSIAVPVAAWLTDPRVHVLDWVNPDDVVKPLMRTADALGNDAAANKRTNDNLRRIFG